jgi:nitrite reductase (cytochrome c-552)
MADATDIARYRRLLLTTMGFAALAAIAIAALLVNIFEHRQEAKNPFYRVVELNDTIDDPATWGKDFPMQYDLYLRTVDQERTRYGGSEALPHSPTGADPRTIVSRSKLDDDERLKEMWAGYAFSLDYREKRGHAYMLEDQTFTGRQQAKPPGTCLNCHASMVVTYNQLGNGDIFKGFEAVNHMPYTEARKLVKHPVACIDCHDPGTMQLRITRPAFIEGMRALKASQGIPNYDVNKQATRQEMRAFVCGQCHVTYYFHGAEKRLTFPWSKGLKLNEIVAHENDDQVTEWSHAESGAPMIKARHPEFETWNQGIHARSGVACADCHMPYLRQGGLKISDHNVRSPLLNINRACQTCHRWPEQEIKDRVEEIQTRFYDTRNLALNALVDLIHDIKAAKAAGAGDQQLAAARDLQRKAQFYIDFLISENSMGFHADQYAVKSLAEAIDFCRLGQVALRRTIDVNRSGLKPALPAPRSEVRATP